MKNDNQKKQSTQTTVQKPVPTRLEVKPKLEFGAIQITAIFGFILITIVGIVIRLWWTKRERLIKASDELHAAFAPSLAQLYIAKRHTPFDVSPAPNTEKILCESLVEQAIAIEKYRIFVPKHKRDAYQKAWDEYHIDVEYGYDTTSLRQDIDDPCAIYEKRIHDILAFGIHYSKK